ncbi:type II secretion system F family protein [Akkermansiaceae bacterium]|nr:type II secretion system F family protein [Akkermansiaceae bacterium]
MPSFYYQARAKSGQLEEGEIIASSSKAVLVELRKKGLQLVKVEEATKAKKQKDAVALTKSGLIVFTEELSALLSSGLPLEPALASMENRSESGALKDISKVLRSQISDGVPFHKALAQASPLFDDLYRNLVAAGEESGSLASIISLHAKYLKEQAELKSKLVTAMIYPMALVLLCLGVAYIFIFYLLPQLSVLLESKKGGDMPLGVTVGKWLGSFLTAYWVWLISAIVILIFAVKLYFSSQENLMKWDKAKLKLPFFGRVMEYAFYVQWLKTLSNLLANGVPLMQALDLTRRTVQNRYCKKTLEIVSDKVKDGLKITTSMHSAGIFPASMIDLIAVADQTGNLEEAVKRTCTYYESKMQEIIKWFLSSFTIVILFFIAALVAVFCYTMLQAIYGSMEGMGR